MTDDELFTPHTDRSEKVRCTICGRTGYPGGPWQDPCRKDHPYSCSCGRRFTGLQAIAGHLRHAGQDHFTSSRPTTGH